MLKNERIDGGMCSQWQTRRFMHVCFLAALMTTALAAVAKNNATLPKLVVHAKYVLITTYNGPDLTNPRVMADDSQAVVDVEDAIRKWGQYIVVNGTSQKPDLVLLVRKGRVAEVKPMVGIQSGSNSKTSVTPNTESDFGSSQDMLALYDGPGGIDQAPLWRSMESGGLSPPDMSLVRQLRAAVEAAAKVP
ncbi:MAG TPA: hypothetical protein VE779_11270 [Candidatus Angelobacter sp.]|nr:hypothetical protein [Candidatus Angelobacter sp.]